MAGPDRLPVFQWGAFVAILLAQLMMVIDGTVIYTALPAIAADLGFLPSTLSWVPNIYMLILGGFMLLGGRTGDLLGQKRVFMWASMVFVVASCAAGLAESAAALIISRAGQGLAAAFAAPSAFSLLMLLFPVGPMRARAITGYIAVSGAGSALGLLAGGVLISAISWRCIFFINLPVGVLLLTVGGRYLPASTREAGRFDLAGAVTCTTGMILLAYGLVKSAQAGASDVALSLTAGIAFLLAFIAIEHRVSHPMLPLSLFRCPQRTGAYLSKLLLVGGMLGTFFFLTQYAQNRLGLSAFDTALIFLPLALMQFFVVIFVVPHFASRVTQRTLLIAGMLVALSGMLWLHRLDGSVPNVADFTGPMLLLGAGSGAALVPLALFSVYGVTPSQAGAASGMVNVTHYLGGAAGTAAMFCLSAAIAPERVNEEGALVVPTFCAALFFALAIVITVLTARKEL